MSIPQFFVNAPFNISQNTQLYAQNLDVPTFSSYDYILNIDAGIAEWNTMNQLFSERSFEQVSPTQNTAGEDIYNINLALNMNGVTNLLHSRSAVEIYSQNSAVSSSAAYTTLSAGKSLLGLRFLEILATKIFGHSQARAAIANDSAFYQNSANSLIQQIASGLNNALQAKQNDIFNSYVETGRVANQAQLITNNNVDVGNDVNMYQTFNFGNSNWEFPMVLTGNLINMESNHDLATINNGPTTVGGNLLVNGQYGVPILLKFHLNQAPNS
jgi:hypothetical protein